MVEKGFRGNDHSCLPVQAGSMYLHQHTYLFTEASDVSFVHLSWDANTFECRVFTPWHVPERLLWEYDTNAQVSAVFVLEMSLGELAFTGCRCWISSA